MTLTTTRRVYYLTCKSVKTSPVRGVRWTYPADPTRPPAQDEKTPRLLPHPDEPRLYHVGYQLQGLEPAAHLDAAPALDDGKKFYIVYPEMVLFGTVPLVRLIGPNGPQVVNSHQFLNVVMLDLADVPRVELRVGTGEQAELVTITRGPLRTIACPNDHDCPRWPAAAPAPGREVAMNGNPPHSPQVPPSVQRARQHPHRRASAAGPASGGRAFWRPGGAGRVAMVVAKVVATMQTKTPHEGRHGEYDGPLLGAGRPFSTRRRSRTRPPEEQKPVDTTAASWPPCAARWRRCSRS